VVVAVHSGAILKPAWGLFEIKPSHFVNKSCDNCKIDAISRKQDNQQEASHAPKD
jgi:hypothetical protein